MLLFRNLRTDNGLLIKTITLNHLADTIKQLAHELVLGVLLDEEPGTSAADLTLVEEDTGDGTVDGSIDISVSKDDVRSFTTEFERYSLQVSSGSLNDDLTCFVFTGESNLVDVHVLRDGRTGGHHAARAAGKEGFAVARETATDKAARAVHGTNPQNLLENIVRQKIYDLPYWKNECFALTAETVAQFTKDKARQKERAEKARGRSP